MGNPLPGRPVAGNHRASWRRSSGTTARPLQEDQLAQAIELLAPAEACDAYDHPDLAAWRREVGSSTVAVFVA
jgi:hypothetical protein